jgi:RNA polymerase sigma-70 factor (ECF subfamily)
LVQELIPLIFGPPRKDAGRERAETDRRERETEPASVLIERIRLGDPDAFDVMVIEHLEALVGFAKSFVGSIDAAEDVVQDALAGIWKRRDTLPREGSIRAYLFSTVRNRALDMLKYERVRTRARTRLESEVRAAAFETDSGENDLIARQTAAVRNALRALPERQRTAVALRYSRGLKVTEIAAVFGVSAKAAEQVLVRALRTLREVVREG